jgi:hypothetical protein
LLVLLATGSAAAQLAVSDGGSPTYTHAISVPPGIAGLAPKIGLFYAGGGVNGPVGHGWSIQGISSITRCPSTQATDGVRGTVTYGPTDKLCLDGHRLIQTDAFGVVSPFPQTNDSRGLSSGYREFRTEKDTYARIRAYGVANGADANGPAYFKVWTKSGLIYEYGAGPSADANTQALVTAQGKSAAMAWAVARISDTAGNYIDFKYEQRDQPWGSGPSGGAVPGREWNVLEIQYTGRVGQAPTNKVVFSYTDRANEDRAEAYHQGSKNVSVRLLQTIRTYVNSPNPTVLGPAANRVKARVIKLSYQTSAGTKRSLVSAITECVGEAEAKCLPATTFTYTPGGNEAFQKNTAFWNSSLATLPMHSTAGNLGVITGDFNADGKTDFIRWSDTPASNQLWLSNGDGTFAQVPGGTGAGQFNITDQNLFKSDGCFLTYAGDFNGDGATDLLRYSYATKADATACATYGSSLLYLSRADGAFTQQTVGPSLIRRISRFVYRCILPAGQVDNCVEPGDQMGWTAGYNFYVFDVNGDGIADIVTTILPAQTPSQPGMPPPSADQCLTIVCTRVYLGSTTGAFTEVATNVANKSLYSGPSFGYSLGLPSLTLDTDGDGLQDVIVSSAYFQTARAWRSRGDGNFDCSECARRLRYAARLQWGWPLGRSNGHCCGTFQQQTLRFQRHEHVPDGCWLQSRQRRPRAF